MVLTAKRAAEICREWYVTFRNKGKGEEKCVLELLDAADTIEALGAAQPKWISVEDRLPGYNAGMRFIVSRDDGTVCEGRFEVSNGRWYKLTTDGLWEIEVTHWMPLPQPPKE